MTVLNIRDQINSTNSVSKDEEKTCSSKRLNEKNMYEKYANTTLGTVETYFESLLLKQFTNPTKSKYDNVIGWVRLG